MIKRKEVQRTVRLLRLVNNCCADSLSVVLHRLRFTLVSEPPADEDDEDCIEIGYAYVSLSKILQTGRDLIGAEIPSQQLIASF